MNSTGSAPQAGKFGEEDFERSLRELAVLYEYNYKCPMPELRPGSGFQDEMEIERLGRLIGVVLKMPVSQEKAIDPAESNTGSHFAYVLDRPKISASDFVDSNLGKIYSDLHEQTMFMIEEGVSPEIAADILRDIYKLPPNQRAAQFARALAYEGRTFRAVLRATRFAACNPSVRSALAAVVATQAGTATSAAAAAGFLSVHLPWLALYPPAAVTAVVGLILVMGVEGFCAWSGPYLAKFSKTRDLTDTEGDNG